MSVQNMIEEIRKSNSSKVNKKQEIEVMAAMVNDYNYKPAILNKQNEVDGYICPAECMDKVATQIIKSAGIGATEAEGLAKQYEYTKNDASQLLDVSKEFVNCYMDTGRKLSLGKREKSDITLQQKINEECDKKFHKKVGEASDGSPVMEEFTKHIPEHKTIKVKAKY